MLDTIRQLSKQAKLKELIISNFVPPEEVMHTVLNTYCILYTYTYKHAS